MLGTIYSRSDSEDDETRIYRLEDLKNIGSILDIKNLIEGQGPFAPHGEHIFNDYWMNYLTADMAQAIDSNVPYHNLEEYFRWRSPTP